jgi:hypothetical protein
VKAIEGKNFRQKNGKKNFLQKRLVTFDLGQKTQI